MIKTWREAALNALEIEIATVANLRSRIDDGFAIAVEEILASTGDVIVTGLGKSGIVGVKLAASLASTGTPSFFIHSTDALHGDAGTITPTDVIIAISNSGSTNEVVTVAELATKRGCPVIAMTGITNSALGKTARTTINIGVQKEADPLDLVPTSSTTATIVLGDALVVALMAARGITPADFGANHPGGALGNAVRGLQT